MCNSAEFKLSLIKPMLVFIALITLNATVAIAVNHATHVQPYWQNHMHIWNTSINVVLIGGWLIYVQMRRRKASRQQ